MNRSDSTRRRPFSTFFTADFRLSNRISGNTPPNHSNACTCSSRNACWVSTSDAWQNAAPENDARITNRCTFTDTPAEHDQRLAPVDLRLHPGRVDLRHEHLPDRPPQLALARPHVLTDRDLRDISTVLINQPPPDPPRRMPLLAAARRDPPTSHSSITARYGPNFGAGLLTGARFAGGTGDANACFTVRR